MSAGIDESSIGPEQVVWGAVLLNDHDHVLNRSVEDLGVHEHCTVDSDSECE
jgi:hypothetical protein